MLTIIDPLTNHSYPSVHVGNRQCYAVPHGRAFAVRVEASVHSRHEAVISVDGRNVLDNTPAAMSAGGVVFTGSYVCKGFQISAGEARQFVHMPAGQGHLTAERAGATEALGMVAVALYGEQTRRPLQALAGAVYQGHGRSHQQR